jgi:hypothetical protein
MSEAKWAEIQQRYMSAEQRDALEQAYTALPRDFDHDAHHAKFKDLDRRIVAALPMDPASPRAQAFLDEWEALIEPFIAVAKPAMLEGMMNMLGNIEEWQGEVDSDFSAEAYRFHIEAHKAREAMKQG